MTQMIIIIAGLFGLLFETGALSCDGYQYTVSGTVFKEPAGVCLGAYIGGKQTSLMYECTQAGAGINQIRFDSADCTGIPTAVSNYLPVLSQQVGATGISATCCTGNQCNYAMKRMYETVSCADSTTNVGYTDSVSIFGECSGSDDYGSKVASCTDGEQMVSYTYLPPATCPNGGIPLTTTNGECLSTAQTHVLCGTADAQCNGQQYELPAFVPTLTCNGLETRQGSWPTGVCFVRYNIAPGSQIGFKYECAANGKDVNELKYSTTDCSTGLQSTTSFLSIAASLGIEDYVINCCESECEWGAQRVFLTETCSDDTNTAATYFDLTPNIVGQCIADDSGAISAEMTSCTNGGSIHLQTYSNGICQGSGTTDSSPQNQNGYCDSNGNQFEIRCGTAATQSQVEFTACTDSPTTSPTTQPTLSPTAPTPNPTTAQPTIETASPTNVPTRDTISPTQSTNTPSKTPTAASVGEGNQPGGASTLSYNCIYILYITCLISCLLLFN